MVGPPGTTTRAGSKLFILQSLTSAVSRLHLFPSVHLMIAQLTSTRPESPSPQRRPLVSGLELQAVHYRREPPRSSSPRSAPARPFKLRKKALNLSVGSAGFFLPGSRHSTTGPDAKTAEAGPSTRGHCSKFQESAVTFLSLSILASPFPLLPEFPS